MQSIRPCFFVTIRLIRGGATHVDNWSDCILWNYKFKENLHVILCCQYSGLLHFVRNDSILASLPPHSELPNISTCVHPSSVLRISSPKGRSSKIAIPLCKHIPSFHITLPSLPIVLSLNYGYNIRR